MHAFTFPQLLSSILFYGLQDASPYRRTVVFKTELTSNVGERTINSINV